MRYGLVIIGAALCGCSPPVITSAPAPSPLTMKTSASATDYAPYTQPGTASLHGQAFLTTRGGDVKLGAGRPVTIDPATPYALEWHAQVAGDVSRFNQLPPDSLFRKAHRAATIDAQGNFRFTALPPGKYIVRSTVTWEAPTAGYGLSMQGGVVADTITLVAGEQRELILNTVLGTAMGEVSTVPFITKEEIGSRAFSPIGDEIIGISCSMRGIEPISEEAARASLAARAAAVKADAVTDVVCERGGLTMRYNCMSHFKCRGRAIRWVS